MKASEVITKLQKQIQSNGDLEIGIFNADLNRFVAINWVVIQEARKPGPGRISDDATLGSTFVALKATSQ